MFRKPVKVLHKCSPLEQNVSSEKRGRGGIILACSQSVYNANKQDVQYNTVGGQEKNEER